jgi:hypothetical protein
MSGKGRPVNVADHRPPDSQYRAAVTSSLVAHAVFFGSDETTLKHDLWGDVRGRRTANETPVAN